MLRVENLSIQIGGRSIIRNISFELKQGETIGIVGESGSGKSITSLSIMGLLPYGSNILSGRALFDINNEIIDLYRITEKKLEEIRGREIAMIFQEPLTCLNPSMICGKQVVEAIENNTNLKGKKADSKCLELLAEMHIPDPKKIFNSYPHQISGGQKQRVMIAMAIAANPKILIADEPTTALDVTVQKELILLLKEIQKNYNIGMIFISHDLGVIHDVADFVLVMKDGEIVESGPTTQVLKDPKSQYTRALISSRPKFGSKPSRLSTFGDFYSENKIDANKSKPKSGNALFSSNMVDTEYIIKRSIWGNPIIRFKALDNVSFNLYEGEVLGLVGESGSGKTTLGRTILKLIENSKGTILYKGVDIKSFTSKKQKEFRKEVQLIFQDPYSSLNPRMTIGQILIEPLKVNKIYKTTQESKERVYDLLAKVGLDKDSFHKYPHEFSGGQRQRIVIARALSVNPKVIICDEIVSALDVSVQAQILNLLKELKQLYNLTLLFISHDLAVVNYISDRTMVMKNGSIVEEGASCQVFTNPTSEYTKKLIESMPGI